ncbi:MAG TPA: NAD(+)/NADH kinase [Bacteroidota bacterium]|nr:NAD(+)/NADH kinase [Bacteroidota bacterium]
MKFGIVGNLAKDTISEAVLRLLNCDEKEEIEFLVHEELGRVVNKKFGSKLIPKHQLLDEEHLVQQSDIIIAFGGDGTILSTARMVGRAQVPIVGINLGKLGFLAELSLDEMDAFIRDILNNQHAVEERTVIKVSIDGTDNELTALNEVVVDKSVSSRAIQMAAYVDNDYLIGFTGDGLIVATPTGTTGYALAAGGPIVVPTTSVLTIQPISAHTLTARTMIVPDESIIRIDISDGAAESRVTVDGQQEIIVKPPVTVTVQKADYTIKLVKPKDRSYYDVLRAKLMWGRDLRVYPRNSMK